MFVIIVPNGSKILIWKQITTCFTPANFIHNCSQWFKDTNLKANHNNFSSVAKWLPIVPNGSKILIWKQITTRYRCKYNYVYCSQWFKDTNLKANHNLLIYLLDIGFIVPNGSKILIWKQITTMFLLLPNGCHCSQWFKDTNLKANHNIFGIDYFRFLIVPNGSKILIWKQITTITRYNISHA